MADRVSVGMDILVIRFSSLGDLVTLEPTFRALRHFHRHDNITFVTSQVGKELYDDTGYFDRIVVASGEREGRLLHRAHALRAELGNPRFAVIYHLQTSRFSHLLTLLLRKERVVHIAASTWQKLFSIKVRFRPAQEILRAAGFDATGITDYFRDASNRSISLGVDAQRAESFRLRLAGPDRARPVAALAPGSSSRWESKKWGDEHFAELASKLQEADWRVIIVGSKLENAAAQIIMRRADRALDFTGHTSVGQLKALLSNADVFIGNDSGPAHIAAAVGAATVTLFAPTGEIHCVRNMAYRDTHICISADRGTCRTCYEPNCPKSHECMATISADRVFTALLELAQSRQPRGN